MGIRNKLSALLGAKATILVKEALLFNKDNEAKKIIRSNYMLRDSEKGKRCFIIGNGPSINNVDFSLLSDEMTFSVNQLPRRENFKMLKTNYHFWIDKRFFDLNKNAEEDLELIKVMLEVNSAGNRPKVFYSIEAKEMIKEYHLDDYLDIHYIALDSIPRTDAMNHLIDFSHIAIAFPTVVQTVIAFAVYLGFKEIYLLGCDCTGFITIAETLMCKAKDGQYGYTITENEEKRMKKVSKKTSISQELRWYADLFDTYETLYKYCEDRGVKLFNATEGGLLDSIPRIRLSDVVSSNGEFHEQ